MLEDRKVEYFPNLGFIKISGLPPEGWDDMTTEKQFNEVYKVFKKFKPEIKAIGFDH